MNYGKIIATAHYAPAKVVSNDDLGAIMDTNDEWITSRTGIRRRHIAVDENTSDLAIKVAQDLLGKSRLAAEDIDFIIVATTTPDYTTPSVAAQVQGAIGAVNAFAYDMSAACTGFVFALSTAERYINSGLYKNVMVIGAETLSKVTNWNDRRTAVLFGDAAGGLILSSGEKQHILAEKLRSDGTRGGSLTTSFVQNKNPWWTGEVVEPDATQTPYLTMIGKDIFSFATKEVPRNIVETLELAGMGAGDVDLYLLHQANSRILDVLARKLKVEREKLPQIMDEYGNTSGASIPLILSELVDAGTIKLDGTQTVVFTGFGGGLTWGTLVLHI
ncbi:MAG: ketoacyl-ACP synthase III [Lactobacillales bacterium]|nr:ketoacyl-ACP synthase III [Lactobacillales bacterium]